ncbi:hypothetical protein [Corynebacterium sp.]|uniref:hypothetical protein n=1 Tax=Corynebacterium sp. TaxID=1720 RepID=UPI0028ABE615|nr:hypothetical protein [Corynebacterium sp.]
MMSLKSVTRKGATISATAIAALALASCSAGQITQTSNQVAAVDGGEAESEDGNIAVRDVAIQVEPDTGEASLKFTASNQAYSNEEFTLDSITVDGQDVALEGLEPLTRNTTIVGNSADLLDTIPQSDSDRIQYVATELENEDYGYAGHRPVVFSFSNGDIELNATVSAPQMPAGEMDRDVESTEGYEAN